MPSGKPNWRRQRVRGEMSTKEKILVAAESLFATETLPGVNVDAIARAAGVNKRLIYHYFGDKVSLYQEVLRRAHRRWTTFDYLRNAPKDPVEFVDGFIVWSFEKYMSDSN